MVAKVIEYQEQQNSCPGIISLKNRVCKKEALDLCGTHRIILFFFSCTNTFRKHLYTFRSITNFELVTQTHTKILVILREIRQITQNPREMKYRFNLNRF